MTAAGLHTVELADAWIEGVALVPREQPHEVRNAGERVLRFAAGYAGPDVVTRYEAPVQPGGNRERRPVE